MVRVRKASPSSLLAKAEAKGYRRGQHLERDQLWDVEAHNKKTKANQDRTLQRYLLWQIATKTDGLTEEEARKVYLSEGVDAPELADVKDFLRFYAVTSNPTFTAKVTVRSMKVVAEWFFAGFTRITRIEWSKEERSEVYKWVRHTLTADGLAVNAWKPKYNFKLQDLDRLLRTLWKQDDQAFTHGRYRVQFTFIIRVFCWTGARIGAFFTGGLRYRDVELVLQRTPTAPWKIIYRIDQRWVKGNRDPENIVFGVAGHEHEKLIYDDTAFLLSMAIADQALFGFDSLADLQEQRIPNDDEYLVLRWRDEAQDLPILRKCTQSGGLSNEPMPRQAFQDMFQRTMSNAGYSCSASVHSIRRELGRKVDKIYTEVERSQHLTQADTSVFGESYVANMSSVDGRAAFLNETIQHSHIDYFQSLEKFREEGLPCRLPVQIEERLKHELRLSSQQADSGDMTLRKTERQQLANKFKARKREELQKYQQAWIRQQRDQKIISRGADNSSTRNENLPSNPASHLLFPERFRLAQLFTSAECVTSERRWRAMRDLHQLCVQDLPVFYLPGHTPSDGHCPARSCCRELNTLPKARRNSHIQDCLKQEIATLQSHLKSDVHYCYCCYEWITGLKDWNKHCLSHLHSLSTKQCGSITHCHTLVRPAFCPYCLQSSKTASQRLQSWCRDHALWKHIIEEHTPELSDSLPCPHPLCKGSHFNDVQALYRHFMDDHGLSRTLPGGKHRSQSSVPIKRTEVDTHPVQGYAVDDHENLKHSTADSWDPTLYNRGHTNEISWTPVENAKSLAIREKAFYHESGTISPALLTKEDVLVTASGERDGSLALNNSGDDESVYLVPDHLGDITDPPSYEELYDQLINSPGQEPDADFLDYQQLDDHVDDHAVWNRPQSSVSDKKEFDKGVYTTLVTRIDVDRTSEKVQTPIPDNIAPDGGLAKRLRILLRVGPPPSRAAPDSSRCTRSKCAKKPQKRATRRRRRN